MTNSGSETGLFVELDDAVVQSLPNILLQRLPKASQLVNVVQLYLNGTMAKVGVPTKFYWYANLVPHETCIVGKLKRKNETGWIILAPTKSERATILSYSSLVDWNQNNSFNSVDEAILPYLKEACQLHEGALFCEGGVVYDMRREEALLLDAALQNPGPDIIELRPLSHEDVPAVINHWKYADHNAGEEVKLGVLNISSAGLYLNGHLTSWGYVSMDGGIHAVHTLEECRGRGYGGIMLKYLGRRMAEDGLAPIVHIETQNQSSVAMMERIGFKYSHCMAWVIFEPTKI